MLTRGTALVIFLIIVLGVTAYPSTTSANIVIYSARKEQLMKPLIDAYVAETGTTIELITGKEDQLLEQLKAEGAHTPADLFITPDAGNLWKAARGGLLAQVYSKVLRSNIPAHLRDRNRRWFGLSVRARTIVYNTKKVKAAELSTYEDLADSKWQGRLCLRTSKKVYNRSLVAMMIVRLGQKEVERIVRSWVSNLATDVFSSDTKVLEAVASGQCDIGVVNTYYFGRLMKKNPSLPLSLFWPNQEKGRGVHVNVAGAGVTKYTKNGKEAVMFLEWLSSFKAQRLFADANMEWPANPQVSPHPLVADWGTFKEDTINVAHAGRLGLTATLLMERAGYN